ncbi:MAG: class I SAM-dependent methyltransferase [Bacteroidota bacterium]
MTDTKPYSKLKITFKYILYYFSAKGKHSVHSPLVYGFITQVLKANNNCKYLAAERERKRLRSNPAIIDFVDFGKKGMTFQKKIKTIANNSLKSRKYAQLLRTTAQYFNAQHILELGTSLGITTAYLTYDSSVRTTSLEGSERIAQEAKQVWENLNLAQIQCITGDFKNTLKQIPKKSFDMIYIDGNHQYEPTISYFEQLQKNSHDKTIFIFDDIHYSPSMEKAWKHLQSQPQVTITLDLFFIGIIWIDASLSKENFVLRY